jgi:transposase
VRADVQERNRVQAVLEDANIKIGKVLRDVFGLSGQLMMEALVEGTATAAFGNLPKSSRSNR